MNQNKRILSVVFSLCLLVLFWTQAQTPATQPVTMGTFTRYTSDILTIKTASMVNPLMYSYTKETVFVDGDGNPVAMGGVQQGVPITVYYDKDGDKLIARKVVIGTSSAVAAAPAPSAAPVGGMANQTGGSNMGSKISGSAVDESGAARSTSASGNSVSGIVTWVTTDQIQIKTPSETTPISVTYTPTTNYTDEKGSPLSKDAVATGQQVVVFYGRNGDAMIATNVVVKKEVGSNERDMIQGRSPKQGGETSHNGAVVDPTTITR